MANLTGVPVSGLAGLIYIMAGLPLDCALFQC